MMHIARRYGYLVACIVGILLVLFGAWAAYWWFYKLAPMRHTANPRWRATHSRQAFWEEVQRSIHCAGRWFHDDGFTVGLYGDKSWAKRIMDQLKPDSKLGCASGHKEVALSYITNQDFGEDAKGWITWWKANKEKSQLEWIQDGFARYGITVGIP